MFGVILTTYRKGSEHRKHRKKALHKVTISLKDCLNHYYHDISGFNFKWFVKRVIEQTKMRYTLFSRYFWPSGFLYISTIVPIIWVAELQMLQGRKDGLPKDKNHDIRVTGKKVCELGMTIGLILGRWLIPSGQMSRDQLSSLLLGYVGNAADTLDFIATAEVPEVSRKPSVTVAVLAIYTWSICQFCLVTTATMQTNDNKDGDAKHKMVAQRMRNNKVAPSVEQVSKAKLSVEQYVNQVRSSGRRRSSVRPSSRNSNGTCSTRGSRRSQKLSIQSAYSRTRARASTLDVCHNTEMRDRETTVTSLQEAKILFGNNSRRGSRRSSRDNRQKAGAYFSGRFVQATVLPFSYLQPLERNKEEPIKRREIHGEMFQILVTLLMQDGPFFILRLYLFTYHSVDSEMHILFMCKNAVIIILLVYRLLVLDCNNNCNGAADSDDVIEAQRREKSEARLRNTQRAVLDQFVSTRDREYMFIA